MITDNAFVLDASMALAWCFKSESTEHTETVFTLSETATIVIPTLWYLEVANVCMLAQRSGRINTKQCEAYISALHKLNLQDHEVSNWKEFSNKCIEKSILHQLSVYDCRYLLLAIETSLPIATLDKALIKAAKRESVHVL